MLLTSEAEGHCHLSLSTDDCVHVYFLKQQAKGNVKSQYKT